MAIGEVRIASLKRVASQGFSSAFEGVLSFVVQSCFSSEAKITSLLAPSGALPSLAAEILSTWCFISSLAAEVLSTRCCR